MMGIVYPAQHNEGAAAERDATDLEIIRNKIDARRIACVETNKRLLDLVIKLAGNLPVLESNTQDTLRGVPSGLIGELHQSLDDIETEQKAMVELVARLRAAI